MSDPLASPAPIPPPHVPPGPVKRLFVGRDGLRATWSVVLFILVFVVATIVVLAVVNVADVRLFGRLAAPDINTRAMSPHLIALSSYPFVAGLLVATIVMARSERRSPWSYGLARPHAFGLFAVGAGWGFLALSALIGLLAITGHITVGGPTNPPLVAAQFAAKWAIAFLGVGLFGGDGRSGIPAGAPVTRDGILASPPCSSRCSSAPTTT